ncbi:hypothetical protein KM043_000862 [Ampulex compressa]|nr:hypothetical protein KM043_000862 [Ampulex compressa]
MRLDRCRFKTQKDNRSPVIEVNSTAADVGRVESPPRNALEEAIGPITLAREKAGMAGEAGEAGERSNRSSCRRKQKARTVLERVASPSK